MNNPHNQPKHSSAFRPAWLPPLLVLLSVVGCAWPVPDEPADAVAADGASADGSADGLVDAGDGDPGFIDPDVTAQELPPSTLNPDNKAPTLVVLAPAQDAVVAASLPLALHLQLGDDVTLPDAMSLKVTVKTGGATVGPSKLQPDQSLLLALSELAIGPLVLAIKATDSDGAAVSAELTLQVVAEPGSPSVTIEPSKPITTDNLLAVLKLPAGIANVHVDDYAVRWSLDGTAAGDGLAVDATQTVAGDTWTAEVLDLTTTPLKVVAKAEVKIANSVPTPAVLALQPWQPSVISTVACILVAGADDLDGDPVNLQRRWTLNGVELPGTATLTALALATPFAGAWKPGFAVLQGDVLGCSVTPTDGEASAMPTEVTAVLLGFDACGAGQSGCSSDALCAPTSGATGICTCKAGFAGSGKTCTDIDECGADLDVCDLAATCTNTVGGYTCTCPDGMLGDGKTCDDVDECKTGAAACDLAATCTNTVGGFTCTCGPGYGGDGQTCADVDECSEGFAGASACALAADCTNTVGSYACACKAGYSGDGAVCDDIDECQTNHGGCSPLAGCVNLPGSVTCTACPPGTTGDGKTCTDIDECAINHGGCSLAAECSNTVGDYFCVCGEGTIGDGLTCIDVDECQLGSAGCAKDATCTNNSGGFQCTCAPGFVGDGLVCDDIDECKLGTAGCSANANCSNVAGGANCSCKPGFVGDGSTCTDVDECKLGSASCATSATCANTDGGYACACKPGFVGDGKTCKDVDECVNGAAQCAKEAVCLNNLGGFACACAPGYDGDGKTCQPAP